MGAGDIFITFVVAVFSIGIYVGKALQIEYERL